MSVETGYPDMLRQVIPSLQILLIVIKLRGKLRKGNTMNAELKKIIGLNNYGKRN